MTSPLLVPGDTCWRIERANRFSFIVDAAEYYRAAKQAIVNARHSVMLIGWDFDSRIELEPEGATVEGPNKLGPFLLWAADRRKDVQFHLLKWNLGAFETLLRGETPYYAIRWMLKSNFEAKLDAAHPPLAAHHQKIVVIDDALAFCGGIDMTGGRWDTRAHKDEDPSRRTPRGKPSQPWHDATTCVDGPVAKALGELARERWLRATGVTIAPPPPGSDPWPAELAPTLTDVDVAVSRTVAAYGDYGQICEAEALYLASIAKARRYIYVESQYFASRRIAEAIVERLKEPDGPEVVVVNPLGQEGWLEEVTMGAARAKLLRHVETRDPHDRFRIFQPVTAADTPIYVHAKLMVMDDRILRVGSSNLNNRSMGFDTECDLAIDAGEDPALQAKIAHIRDDLLAEHLGVTPADVAEALRRTGSLIGAIEALSRSGRRLLPLGPREVGVVEDVLAESDLVDPERPPTLWGRARKRVRRRRAQARAGMTRAPE